MHEGDLLAGRGKEERRLAKLCCAHLSDILLEELPLRAPALVRAYPGATSRSIL